MTIREAAARAQVTNQAIYKRLKARGISPESIRGKSGELTEEGLVILQELFPTLKDEGAQPPQAPTDEPAAASPPPSPDELERLTTRVEELTKQVEELTTKLTTAEAREKALADERDYLRGALERSQQLQAITAQKIPNPPPSITDGSEGSSDGKRRGWWARLWGKG